MTVGPLTVVVLGLTALFAGTVDAIAGGGGLITLPAILAAGVPADLAFGTNKGQSTFGSFTASVAYWRAGHVDRRLALFSFPLAIIGSMIGAHLVMGIDKDAIRPLVIAMLIGAAVLLAIKKPTRDVDVPAKRGTLAIALTLAFVIGGYDGFFGPGTGTFLVVGFVALCGKGTTGATADAKIVNLAANLAALASFAHAGRVVWAVSLPMAAGQLLGGAIGARLAIRGGAKMIRMLVLVISGALVVKLGIDLAYG